MKENTYHYEAVGGVYHLNFFWHFGNAGLGERFVVLENLNALIFMIDMLKKLGYREV